MDLGLSSKLFHILTSFWFISGVVGRDITFWQARRARSVQAVQSLLQISEFFEHFGVIPGSMAVLIFGILAGWLRGWPVFGFLQGSSSNWLLVSLFLFLGLSAVIGPLRLVPRRRQRSKALEAALEKMAITGELTAALNDKVVNAFRSVELSLLIVIIALMVLKPF